MCSGCALTVAAIVYVNVGLMMRPSPAMTRVRSDDVVPQRPIQRRSGNQYSTATVRNTRKVKSTTTSFGYGLRAITHFAFWGWPRLISLLGAIEPDVKTSGGQP